MRGKSTECGYGFTLIETLLVLSVFGLLLGIGAPRIVGWVVWNRQVQQMEALRVEVMRGGGLAMSRGTPIGLRAGRGGRALEWIVGEEDRDGEWLYGVIGEVVWSWGGVKVSAAAAGVMPEEVLEREAEEWQGEWRAEEILWWDAAGLPTGGEVRMAGRSGGVWVITVAPLVGEDVVVRYER